MEWLFGKKEEKPKDPIDTIKIEIKKGQELPKLKPVTLESNFKMPEKPKIKT